MNTPLNIDAELQRVTELLDSSQPRTAEQSLRKLLNSAPDDSRLSRMLGYALLQQDRLSEALDIFEKLFADSNKSPISVLDLARALGQANRLDKAAEILRDILEEVPTLTPGWYLYGDILVEQRNFAEARKAFRSAAANDPFRVQIDQSKQFMRNNDFEKAEQILQGIVQKDPLHTEALAGLEALAMTREDWFEAERLFGLIRKRTRYWPTMLTGLAQLFLMTNRVQEALDTLETLTKIQPEQIMAWNMLGTANEILMRHEQAIAAFEKSLQLEPNQPRAFVSIGNIQRVIGNRAESAKTLESALRFTGMNGEAYWGLSNLKDYEFSDGQIADMRESLDRDSTSLHNAAPMFFALAMAMEQRADYDAAFAYYIKGNRIQKNISSFDADTYACEIDRIASVFDPAFLSASGRTGSAAGEPIFIIGMPRSGSTLVEQILASHSKVDATMELPFIEQFVREFGIREVEIGPYPECLRDIDHSDFDALAQRYLAAAAVYRQSAPRFTDKMPNNVVHVGLIHLMFPDAVFIDVTRHPLDTCISGFKQRFAVGQPFSYTLSDLGSYYRGYRRLMEHWSAVLPDKVTSVRYEDLVTDPEPVIRAMLQFCGLGFEPACLEPHKTARPIRTPSSEQVRQPISAERIGYWENFAGHLGPLKKLLGPEIARYESRTASR